MQVTGTQLSPKPNSFSSIITSLINLVFNHSHSLKGLKLSLQ